MASSAAKNLTTEGVQSKGEGGGYGCVGPKAGCVCHRSVAVGMEVADEALIGNDAGFL